MKEQILYEEGKHRVGITEEGNYFEAYGVSTSKAIVRGAGLYIKHLRERNLELEQKAELSGKMIDLLVSALAKEVLSKRYITDLSNSYSEDFDNTVAGIHQEFEFRVAERLRKETENANK